jgi:ABC-type enterochelin transport system permease subunit
MKTVKNCSEVHTNVSQNTHRLAIPEEYSLINKLLLDTLNSIKSSLLNIIDQTITVKQLYCLLCQCGVLKEAT